MAKLVVDGLDGKGLALQVSHIFFDAHRTGSRAKDLVQTLGRVGATRDMMLDSVNWHGWQEAGRAILVWGPKKHETLDSIYQAIRVRGLIILHPSRLLSLACNKACLQRVISDKSSK